MAEVLNVAKDYNKILGGRWIKLGAFSGEDFYNNMLRPKYLKAISEQSKLIIELDGTTGYPSSFLDQSFGELARQYGKDNVKSTIEFRSEIFAWVADYITRDIWDKTN